MQIALLNKTVARVLPAVPKSLVWRVSRRYIAGASLDDALAVVASLNASGISATLDILGENIASSAEALVYRDLYLQALAAIDARGLDCNISVKLTEMGLRLDNEACLGILTELASDAARRGNTLRIDMEDSTVTTVTLDIYRELRRSHANVGAVLQACLHRTPGDINRLAADGIANLRLCKGIYLEPPDIAWQSRDEIRSSYRECLERLIAANAEHVAIATHDPPLVEHALDVLRQCRWDRQRYEFQFLLGVAEGLRDELVAAGHRVRVYVPFGAAWFAYSLRRLRENPQIAGHVMRNLFRRS